MACPGPRTGPGGGTSSVLLQIMVTNAPGEAPCLETSCLYLQGAPRPRETGLQQWGGAGTSETQPGPTGSWTSTLTPPLSDALPPLIRPALTLPPSQVPSLPAPVLVTEQWELGGLEGEQVRGCGEGQSSRSPGEVTARLVVTPPAGEGERRFPLRPHSVGEASGGPQLRATPATLPAPPLRPTAKATGAARPPPRPSPASSVPRVPQALGQG